MIGLSLPECVLDIVSGKVKPEDVTKIVSGTRCTTKNLWSALIENWRNGPWAAKPDECERVARQLIDGGKVEQPRLVGTKYPFYMDTHWVSSEEQIEWLEYK